MSKPLFFWSENGKTYKLPKLIVAKFTDYIITDSKSVEKAKKKLEEIFSVTPEEAFYEINQKYTRAGAFLKGVRLREGMNQKEFSHEIGVKQGDLSKMENGKRTIGKLIAHRIADKFKVNYKIFL